MNIFVFGSNEAGRHGKGAALYARNYRGAKYGQGQGRQGSSYAIPTKDGDLNVLPLWKISQYIIMFLQHARSFPEDTYELTAIGTGLAGYKAEQIAPLFVNAPDNVLIPKVWSTLLPGHPTWNGERIYRRLRKTC